MARILVVDDDASVRVAIRKILVHAGYEVVEAADGTAALRAYREQPADLVISDIFMPETDGMETTIRLREEFPDTKVVAISGGGYDFDKKQMLRVAEMLGAQRTLTKPFERSELLDVVREVLEQDKSE